MFLQMGPFFTNGSNYYLCLLRFTIRQRRCPWKRPWIDFSSFHFFRDYPKSPSYLKRREFRLEMKRGDRARVQTELVEFIGLPFPFSSKLKIWLFRVVVVQGWQRKVQKSVMHVHTVLLSCSLKVMLHRTIRNDDQFSATQRCNAGTML